MKKSRFRLTLSEVVDISIFIAVSLRNFAIGWALIGFFPNGTFATDSQSEVLTIGGLLFLFSLVIYSLCVMINLSKGDPNDLH